MANQTSMNHMNGRTPGEKLSETAGSVADLAHDAVMLAELQGKLLIEELKQLWRRSANSVIIGLLGGSLVLGSTPLALFGAAELLLAVTGMSRAVCLLTTFAVCTALALTLILWSWRRLRTGLQELDKSRQELLRNLEWLRHVLRRRRRTTRSQGLSVRERGS